MKKLLIIMSSVCLLIGVACKPSYLPKQQYVSWIEDSENGLHNIREIADYRFQVQYQPSAYVELKNPSLKSDSEPVAQMVSEKSSLAHFELKIGSKDRKTPLLRQGIYGPTEYQARVQYLSFEQEKRIYLISETDTLQPVLYHFERSYDLHADVSCSLAFERLPTSDFTLMIDDANLGIGIVNFSFQATDFQAIPALKP